MNAAALVWFARSVERAYGPITALWYVVLQASQFHLWYYASRTLPNMFAFFLSMPVLQNLLVVFIDTRQARSPLPICCRTRPHLWGL